MSLLSKMYFSKYCKDESTCLFSCDSTSSNLARPICSKINKLLKDCQWRIGKSDKIKLNSACWFPLNRLEDNMNIVQHLTSGHGKWNRDVVLSCYNEPIASNIMNMPLSCTGIPDKLLWNKSRDGKCHV